MTQTPTSTTQSARDLAEQFPEINPSNYDHDDVTALNNWGCEVVDVLRTVAAATVSRDREAIAQALLDRFIARGMARMGGPTFPPGTKMASLPASYSDDFYADADAILATPAVCYEAGKMRAELERAEQSFEFIRETLVNKLEEPERSAFWRAVNAREAVRAALAALPVQGTQETILEESQRLDGTLMQTVRLANGQEIVREAPSEAIPVGRDERWRHVKRGSEYTLIGHGQVQAEEPLTDYEVVAIYRGAEGYWVRRKSEFYDGRFERLTDVSTPLVLGGDDIQKRCEQPELSGHDGSEAKSGMREALERIRKLSGHDNTLFVGASPAICSRMADIHQHADSALVTQPITAPIQFPLAKEALDASPNGDMA